MIKEETKQSEPHVLLQPALKLQIPGSLGHTNTKAWGTSTVLGLEPAAGTNPLLHNLLADEE